MNSYQAAYEAAKQERTEIRAMIEKLLARSEALGNAIECLAPVLMDESAEKPAEEAQGEDAGPFPIPMPEAQVHA